MKEWLDLPEVKRIPQLRAEGKKDTVRVGTMFRDVKGKLNTLSEDKCREIHPPMAYGFPYFRVFVKRFVK